MEYTELEYKVINIMFHMMDEIINLQDGYMDIKGESFSRGDLFVLANKLGIEDY